MGHWNTSAGHGIVAVRAFTVAAALLLASAGCIEIQRLLQGNDTDTGGNGIPGTGGPGDDANINDGGGGASAPPTVRITASSPAPFLNEQVTLRCTVVDDGGDPDVTFAFEPDIGRILVDSQAGTAVLIVDEVDLGSEFRFTCSGTNDAGTGPSSSPVSVIPIESPEPPPPPEPEPAPAPDQPPP